jgi:hypothetical protein
MANEWSDQQGRVEDSDKATAATLAAALIASGNISPPATTVEMAAAQAVKIYRVVLEHLEAGHAPGAS